MQQILSLDGVSNSNFCTYDEWESLSEVTTKNMLKTMAMDGLVEKFFSKLFFVEETELTEGS